MRPSRSLDRRARAETVRICEICDLLNVHTDTGYAWIRQGRFPLPVRKIGRHYYAFRDDVDAFFAPGRSHTLAIGRR